MQPLVITSHLKTFVTDFMDLVLPGMWGKRSGQKEQFYSVQHRDVGDYGDAGDQDDDHRNVFLGHGGKILKNHSH